MDQGKEVIFPDDLLKNRNIEGTIFSEGSKDFGIATLSEVEGSAHILRIYQLLYSEDSESFEFVQELAAFTFQSRMELRRFTKRLPDISGLEMLMLLNPLHQSEELLN